MKTYMVIGDKTGILTEPELLSLFGEGDCRQYAHKLYWGSIAMEDIPKQYQQTVQNIVDTKVARWGNPDKLRANPYEMRALYELLVNAELTVDAMRDFFSGIDKLRSNATDEAASIAVSAYPHLKEDGSLIKSGTRINWNDVLKRAAVDLWDTVENNPDNAPTLWEDINYRNGYRLIPEVITVGTAFALNECGWWNDKLYKSILNANVYTPDAYPAGWEIVE